MNHKFIFTILLFTSFCIFAGTARADIVSNFGLGSNAMAMSGAYTAIADDFSACYYNPAGLAYQKTPVPGHIKKGTALYLGTGYMYPQLWTKDPSTNPSSANIAPLSFMQIGLTLGPSALGFLPQRRVYFGFAFYLPTDVLIGYTMRNTSSDRYFVFYDNENRIFGFLADAAYRFDRNVAIGIGADFLAGTNTQTNVSFVQSGFIHSEYNYILIQAAPIAGIMINLNNGAKLGFTYRGELKFNDYGNINLYAADTPIVYQSYDWMKFFIPQQFAAGFSYHFTHRLLGTADLTYINWSNFVDEQGDGRPETKLFDTVVPKTGIRYSINDQLNISAGYAFLRSPVRDQTGVTNWLDSNKNLISLGTSYTFGKIGFWRSPITLSAYLQDTLFETRYTYKTQPVSRYQNGYSAGGSVLDGGVQITLRW